MLDFGREVCGHIDVASGREWLVTNGIGGFAMGTISGVLTRRYHGLLIAALNPPLGRTLMLSKFDETAFYDGRYYPLFVNRWFGDESDGPGLEEPNGHYNIERFHLVGTVPHWTFALADAVLEKRIWMAQGANTTYIQYRYLRGSSPLKLYPKAFINFRDYHHTTIAADWDSTVEEVQNGLKIIAKDNAIPLYLLTNRQQEIYAQDEWHEDYFLSQEEYRGQSDVVEDHLHIADFGVELNVGESVTFVASTQPEPELDGDSAYAAQQRHEHEVIELAEKVQGKLEPTLRQLVLAADQFVVKRPIPGKRDGHSIIAGYPWFGDWGRDTMISIPGITLCTGRPEIAASILRTYAHYVDQGMIPNRFPDVGERPEYNTVDASLWYFQAIRTYQETANDLDFLRDIYPVLQDIINWNKRGTRFNIRMDESDGLIYAGEEGYQLTWMDAKVDDWVVTPRIGKPVEVNALWYNALRCMALFAEQLGHTEDSAAYSAMADKVKESFIRFWYSPEGYCYDVIDGPNTHDTTLRPNQLLAVSLSYSPLDPAQQKAVVDICTRKLITSYGLRSLNQDNPAYVGVYGGDQRKRDAAYHQGTVWGWLIGPFIASHLRVYKNPALARSYLTPLMSHLEDHGLGTISEIFDGDVPFTPRGCIAQAWSVGEYLRACCILRKAEEK